MKRSWIIGVVAVALPFSSCDCDDSRSSPFFEPIAFGTYEVVQEPDIVGPIAVDFGIVPADEQGVKQVQISNVGRDPLTIERITIDPPFYVQNDDPVLQFRDVYRFEIFAESTGEDVTRFLQIRSNDPDEDPYAFPVVMNLDDACAIETSSSFTTWERLESDAIVCWDFDIGAHGDAREYSYTEIPSSHDPRWRGVEVPDIDRRSRLCDAGCACRHGADFTFFQTFVFVGTNPATYRLTMRQLDDGARVTVFNTRYPQGHHASYVYLGQDESEDIRDALEPGLNRVVLTHTDDCCNESRVNDVTLRVDGQPIAVCRDF